MRAAGSSESRFDRLPAWQRSGVLALTVLAISFVLLLLAEAGVRIQNNVPLQIRQVHEMFWI